MFKNQFNHNKKRLWFRMCMTSLEVEEMANRCWKRKETLRQACLPLFLKNIFKMFSPNIIFKSSLWERSFKCQYFSEGSVISPLFFSFYALQVTAMTYRTSMSIHALVTLLSLSPVQFCCCLDLLVQLPNEQ